jgi:hypothetical protein
MNVLIFTLQRYKDMFSNEIHFACQGSARGAFDAFNQTFSIQKG